MSPTNRSLDLPFDDGDVLDDLASRRPAAAPEARGVIQRTKRIRTPRRANSANGMQRRRNKHINW